jgi:amino acid adenylation domain-containing protein
MQRVESGATPVCIGRPIANTRIYILDAQMQPVPGGINGDLYIGGDGLALGYLNRAELTAEAFVPDPFSNHGSLLYRTGDRARYRPDGNLEFLGRADNQVKIRGYRIELEEIEAALVQHPNVRQAVVVAFVESESGDARADVNSPESLIAYVVVSGDQFIVVGLRNFLRQKLPEYMIPSVFVEMNALPLMPNGKVNRKALPPAGDRKPEIPQGYAEPRTQLEELVAQIWREVLKRDQIGVLDNFFDLGGHSLLATRIVARLCANLRVELSLRRIFESPTIAQLAEHIQWLFEESSRKSTPAVVPVNRDGLIPASFSQQRLWFLREIDPKSTAYNIPCVFSIRGPLDVVALERALNRIIARHEILRTTFDIVDGTVVQRIMPTLSIELPTSDIAPLQPDERELRAREIALEDAQKPFDLRNGPLVRARIVRGDASLHWLVLIFDHTVLDGSSMGVLFKELGTLYDAFMAGQADPLPPLPIQYADYAVWQRTVLDEATLAPDIEYWQRQLSGFTPLRMPADYSRPVFQSPRAGRQTLRLPGDLSWSLKELSRREGVTLFMTLLATFQLLLSRYSGQDDVVVGVTMAGRGRTEIENLIGFFINALPLRANVSGNQTFVSLLHHLREACLGAYTHQELPFEKIVHVLNPSRDLGSNPLFQVMFNMVDVSERTLQLAECEIAKESYVDAEAKFDLTLSALEKRGTIELTMVYNSDLFSESRVSIVLEQLELLFTQVTEKPLCMLGDYTLVSPSCRELLPDPAKPLDDSWKGPIQSFVEQWALRTPDRLAIVDSDETWNYHEISATSDQLAKYLYVQGIAQGDAIAIYAQRRSELIVALLGVLKAGAAFVIFDPAYPSPRLAAYVHIAQPKGWIEMETAGPIPDELTACLDSLDLRCRLNLPHGKAALSEILGEQFEASLRIGLVADDAAYVAFTSGSTGEPKGVLGRHGPITHFLPWQKEAFELYETDRFCLLSGLAYNHLHRDIFTALHLGATLHIPPPEIVKEPGPLTEWLRANEISVLHLTPAFGWLLLSVAAEPLASVRRVFFGGDVLSRGEVARIRELAPNATIGCFYGATETQRTVGYYEIPEDFTTSEADAEQPVPLGKGIKDVQLLLLNQACQLAGVGELAEIYVRSPHLAGGYLGDEARTREVFITNPFTNDPNDRLYRTGEMGRYLPGGNVEWAGRTDRRVSVRGFRVELEEIEAVLKRHPAVKDAAVVLQDAQVSSSENSKLETRNPKLDHFLVAYVATDDTTVSMTDLLHGYVSAQLPEYMVPARFVILEELPLSPSAKVDYRGLPSLTSLQSSPSTAMLGPRNEVEAKLAAIFCQVLGREQVGIEDNFFRLGGHSLLAAETAARIREALGIGLELRAFFDSPTVAGLANAIKIRLKPANATSGMEDTTREEIEL